MMSSSTLPQASSSSSSSPMDTKKTHAKSPSATTMQGESLVPNISNGSRLLQILQLSSTTHNPFLPSALASLPPFAPKSDFSPSEPAEKMPGKISSSSFVKAGGARTAISANATSETSNSNKNEPNNQKPAAALIQPKLPLAFAPALSSSAQLQHPPTLPMCVLPPDVASLSVEDVAKEAMRITKESMRKQQQEQVKKQRASPAAGSPAGSTSASHLSHSKPTQTPTPVAVEHIAKESPASPARPSSPVLAAAAAAGLRLNKFVRRLHDMVEAERDKGIVEWRRGLLVLHSTAAFAKTILPQFFNTRNFKTFRRQLNYYGFVHVRSFSNTAASTTTALWVHQDLAASLNALAKKKEESGSRASATLTPLEDPDDLCHILKLRRVEPNEDHKTVEGRRQRKEMALFTVEEDLQVSTKSLQRRQIQALLHVDGGNPTNSIINNNNEKNNGKVDPPPVESALPPPAPLVPPFHTMEQTPNVPLFISVPSPTSEASSARIGETLTAPAAASGEPPKKKHKRGSLVSQRSMSDASSSSVAVVSEPDDETQPQHPHPPKLPPRSTSSAANLLLLLSQGGVQGQD